MVLDDLTDGASRHLYDFYDEGTRKLVFILCLPIIDGVFPALLVTGAVATFSDMVAVALTVFAGAGALAIIYSYAENIREAKRMVLKASIPLLLGALAVALIAPVYSELFHVERLKYAAGLALLVIAGHLAGIDLAEKFSTPAIILTGMVLSVRNPGVLTFNLGYVAPALITTVTAIAGLYAASYLTNMEMNLSYVRRGAAVVLALIAISLFGYDLPSELSLAVFAVALVAALETRSVLPRLRSFLSPSVSPQVSRLVSPGKDGKLG